MDDHFSRRDLIKGLALFSLAIPTVGLLSTSCVQTTGREDKNTTEAHTYYTLPPLPYPYNALEPYIDSETLKIHHDKHHAGYVKKLNNALRKLEEARNYGNYAEVKFWTKEVSYNGSGHLLHSLYWESMSPNGGREPRGQLKEKIDENFGGISNFKKQFTAVANSVEGSGWGVLAYEPLGDKLIILQAEKHQDLAIWGAVPLLVCDVWEHAYYLKYQNRRIEYIKNFFNVINWETASKKYKLLRGEKKPETGT